MTGLSRHLRLTVAAIIAGTAILIASAPALANGLSLIFPDPASPNGHRIYDLYVLITYFAIPIFVGVEVALLYIIFRFRRKHPGQVGASWHGNTTLEIVWTIIPTLIVAAIAFVSYQELVKDFTPEAANAGSEMNIAVTGKQFFWSYTYDEGFTVAEPDSPMVVPAGKMVHMTFDSADVIHSWWVPALTGKTDAVPGYTNQSWIKVDPALLTNCPNGNDRHPDPATGGCFLHGECAELCGVGHDTMQIDVLVLDQPQFDGWVAAQKAKANAPKTTPSPSPSASPAPSPSAAASPSPKPSP
jgi:cytochrome c oxidase subunit II